MNKMLISALALFMLAGCSVSKPGGFERVDEDARSNTVQYKDALELDLANYCNQRGFDKVESLPAQDSNLPGLKKVWYQCNYAVKS